MNNQPVAPDYPDYPEINSIPFMNVEFSMTPLQDGSVVFHAMVRYDNKQSEVHRLVRSKWDMENKLGEIAKDFWERIDKAAKAASALHDEQVKKYHEDKEQYEHDLAAWEAQRDAATANVDEPCEDLG